MVHFRNIPNSAPEALEARLAAGELLLGSLNCLRDAEQEFRQAWQLDHHHVTVNEGLSFILGMSARVRDAVSFRLELIRENEHRPIHLYLLSQGDEVLENHEDLERYLTAAPNDPLARLGQARLLIDRQQYAEGEAILRALVRENPTDAEAQSRLGRRLAEARSTEFLRWHSQLPSAAESHPEIWAARGTWALDHSEPRVAIRCFWEALLLDPNHERANYQLGQLLLADGQTTHSTAFLDRSRQLAAYFIAVDQAQTLNQLHHLRGAADKAEALALYWESLGWYLVVRRRFPAETWALEAELRLRERVAELDLERTPPELNPARKLDLSHYPLPTWHAPSEPETQHQSATAKEGVLCFEDLAGQLGIEFQFYDGAPRDLQTHRMYEFTGGGVAAVDFDHDGWTDIYLTQGSDWPPSTAQTRDLDRLYRNLGDRFVDVTEEAGIREGGFSQGVAANDYDGDGFCDLYVGNIGPNSFYRNNGDGTFSEIADAAGSAGNQWTTSCLLADLNGDRLPDLYVVNYLTGKDVYERICSEANGLPRSCAPRLFEASQDQMFLNLGDGTFRNVTSGSGIEVPNGKGLGIVVADFDSSGRLSLFLANDGVPNFYFFNQTTLADSPPRFSEEGLNSGLAVDVNGRPQACMGVAVGDADGDGRFDLFVTNFFNEYNTLYRQQGTSVFADETRAAGLAESSLKMLGFGTQFVDGELDGWPDLIVANGDVDDFTHRGRPYAMLPQYFRNLGDGRFVDLSSEAAGPYFARPYLGRGMARIDWDRDGREDVVISHLDAPAALVTNRTQKVGNFLQLRFVGTESERTPIGTTVTLEAGGRTWVQQLTAGDGYLASNERLLTFGVDSATQADRIVIRWPAGSTQEFTKVGANQTLLCIEGRQQLLPLTVDR